MTIELSIVFGTVDRPIHLNKCLESIINNTTIEYEVIILDAGKNPAKADSNFNKNNIKIIREPKRLGFAKGYNIGFGQMTGRYAMFLNDDCVTLPYYDIEAVRFMDRNPWCGLGAIYFSNYGTDPFHINEWLGLPYANFGVISKELGDRVGWFDEVCHTYGSDNSLTFKVLLEGKGIAGIPHSKIIHNPITDSNKQENMDRQSEDARNLLLKYRPRLPEMIEIQRRYPVSRQYV